MILSQPWLLAAVATAALTCAALAAEGADDAQAPARPEPTDTPENIRDTWILDGQANLAVRKDGELLIETPEGAQSTLWCPRVYRGPVTIEFEALVPQPKTKLLLVAYGHGSDDTPVWAWQRPDASYDAYNAGPMELYTVAFNRGGHIGPSLGNQLANIRRIGGPDFSRYTSENFRARPRSFWEQWNARSLLGAAREPASGVDRWHRYRFRFEPPMIHLAVDGVTFATIVDHRPDPLSRGSFGLRNMSRGTRLIVRNLTIEGEVVARHD